MAVWCVACAVLELQRPQRNGAGLHDASVHAASAWHIPGLDRGVRLRTGFEQLLGRRHNLWKFVYGGAELFLQVADAGFASVGKWPWMGEWHTRGRGSLSVCEPLLHRRAGEPPTDASLRHGC